jgi:hypothetical protein
MSGFVTLQTVHAGTGKPRATGHESDYETVAASQTNQVLGVTGKKGDFLARLIVTPATTTPGIVQIKDGADTAITVFVGGAASITQLTPFEIPLFLYSRTGAWQITTGANVSVVATGSFLPT